MTLSLPSFTWFWLRPFSLLLLLLGAGLLAQAQSNATPAIRYVRTDGTNADPATATTWATSTTNLQGAIDASAAGDQVWIAAGTYKPGGNANTDREKSFAMKNGVAIYGGFAPTGSPTLTARNPDSFTTVLSGNLGTVGESYHVILNSGGLNATAVLDGFVITDGNANGSGLDNEAFGGGMLNVSSSPTLTNCLFVSNSASRGGGMGNRGSSNPTLTNCRFVSNSASQGGGMYNISGSSPTLTNCNFVSNIASSNRGGGMFNLDNSSPSLTNCNFQSNTASVSGAGMYNQSSSPNLTNCSFLNNGNPSEGGGMDNRSSSPTLTNCRFQGNSAFTGGAMFNRESSNPTLTNCIFLGNKSVNGGWAIFNVGTARLTNCILFNNGGSATFSNGVNIITNVIGTITV
ncbi:MAG TPA: right-handed parallel beta-helix repeat-containing protein, partial [Fibrella sp.]